MPNISLRRNSLFIAGSVLTGLGLALLLMWLWPQLVRRERAETLAPVEPYTQTQPAATGAPAPAAGTASTGTAASAGPLAQDVDFTFADAVKASAPAVVSIYTQRVDAVPASPVEQLFGGPVRQRYQRSLSLGSGVILDSAGHIVTNNHVIESSVEIAVQMADGRTAPAKVVGRDPDTDLALLKIDLPDLPVMQLGRSDRVAVGDVVLAIGNPFGQLSQTVTHGIVSAKGRADLGVATYEDFIQTDAAINEGNSGGALVNGRGQLIGINTAVLGKEKGAEGLSIAIPVDLVRGVVREILEHQRVIRGWIGIETEDVSATTARQYGLPKAGVAVSNVYKESPALEAGVRPGDIIESIDGQPVKSSQDTRARIASRKPGTRLRLGGTSMQGATPFSVDLEVADARRQPR
jgi:serine protease DegS